MAAPAATYDEAAEGAEALLRNRVRLLAGDTGRAGKFWLSDAEVDQCVTEMLFSDGTGTIARPYASAARALSLMARQAAQLSDTRRVGDVMVQDSKDSLVAKFESAETDAWRDSMMFDPQPGDGGPVVGGSGAVEGGPYFRIGMHDEPGNVPTPRGLFPVDELPDEPNGNGP